MEKYLNRLPGWVLLLHQRIVSSKIGYRMARGAVWSMAGGIGARMITIASTVIVARLLGPKGNGEFAIIQSALGFLGVFSGFGLGTAATKYLSEFRKKDPDRASRIFSMTLYTAIISGIVFSISCAVFSSAIAEHVLNEQN